ncbi:MAG TPA: tRNA preQ1(34) S-adenosylmethionine ribosyltransferase-isomerase QueA [Chthoniobacterales bacterium]|nr:tRNA preQ1(34) S-adenosylmethionine ribosyltransferase-isomerase QueA [Chthoniobacterales bacterium]
MSTRLSDYDYRLPRELIANRPLPNRDASRLMVLRRDTETIEHRQFHELPKFLSPDDLLVLNNTRVLPARVFSDDGRIELLLLERLGPTRWRCLTRPGKRARTGAVLSVGGTEARVEAINDDGEREISLAREVDLYSLGTMPLPPYLERRSDAEDDQRYQTVFATTPGAIAAPTAGLHFTPQLLAALRHVFVTLHVGPGTFRPVHTENISEHQMHSEQFTVSADTAEAINRAERVVAVGTTTVRVLESAAASDGTLQQKSAATNIFIYPPFEFRLTDALLTNFHLPRSTLLMLVSAFAGREFILRAYAEAIRERYRFFSYGDCMLIL